MNFKECCSDYIKDIIPQFNTIKDSNAIIVMFGRSFSRTYKNVIPVDLGKGNKLEFPNSTINEELVLALPNVSFILLNLFDYDDTFNNIIAGFDYVVKLANQNPQKNFIGCATWIVDWDNKLAVQTSLILKNSKLDNLGILCAAGNEGLHYVHQKPSQYRFPACLKMPQIFTVGSLDSRGRLNPSSSNGFNVSLYNVADSTSIATCNQIVIFLVLWDIYPTNGFTFISQRLTSRYKEGKFILKDFITWTYPLFLQESLLTIYKKMEQYDELKDKWILELKH